MWEKAFSNSLQSSFQMFSTCANFEIHTLVVVLWRLCFQSHTSCGPLKFCGFICWKIEVPEGWSVGSHRQLIGSDWYDSNHWYYSNHLREVRISMPATAPNRPSSTSMSDHKLNQSYRIRVLHPMYPIPKNSGNRRQSEVIGICKTVKNVFMNKIPDDPDLSNSLAYYSNFVTTTKCSLVNRLTLMSIERRSYPIPI